LRTPGPCRRLAEENVDFGRYPPEGGERSFFSTDGHLDDLDAEFFRRNLEGARLEGALALVSGGFAMPGLIAGHSGLLDWLRAHGAEIAIDPGWPGDGWTERSVDLARDWIAKSDHLLFNEMEITGLTAARDVDTAITRIGKCCAPAPGSP
jgi:sugar/nucleoside kinase (ribokinase family)